MKRFDFLKEKTIQDLSEYGKREAIIDGFLLEKSINIIYGPAGLGKTWLLFAIAKYSVFCGYEIVYLDSDNGVDTVKDRGYDKHIATMGGKIHYINGDTLDSRDEMNEIFAQIETNAIHGYEKAIFILDSLQFFLSNNVYDEGKIDKFTRFCKKIRRAGGTVIIINHATKDGKNMKGGGSLINALDEVWEISKTHDEDGIMQFILTPSKYRMGVKESAFVVDTATLNLEAIDSKVASMDESAKRFITNVCAQLSNAPMSQNKLLEALGYNKSDKSKINLLEKFSGNFWNVTTGANRAKIYTPTHETPTTQEE